MENIIHFANECMYGTSVCIRSVFADLHSWKFIINCIVLSSYITTIIRSDTLYMLFFRVNMNTNRYYLLNIIKELNLD